MNVELDRKRKREYREILGIDESADEEMLKKAYRRLAMEYHPDRPNNKGKKEEAEQMFKKVTEAYEALQNAGSTISILKNSFKSSEIHSSLEQFLFSTGKINSFASGVAQSGDGSGVSGTTSNASFNLGNLNNSSASALFNNLHAKFNIHNNNHSHNTSSNTNTSTSNMASSNASSSSSSLNNNLHANNTNNTTQQQQQQQHSPTTTTTNNVTSNGKSPRRGQSLQTTLRVGFEEGLYGCTKTIEFSRSLSCSHCHGHGAALLSKLNNHSSQSSTSSFGGGNNNCRDCGGKGVLVAKIAGGGVSTPCPSCSMNNSSSSGTTANGSTASRDSLRGLICQECKGSGKLPSKKTCTVSVPPGVASGMQQVFEGEGDEGSDGGQPGDLIICFEVEPHPFYQRHGDDVYCKVPLPFPHAALGTKLEVPSIYGEPVTVDVAPNTQHKHVIKVTEEGFFNSGDGKRGNMYLQICIELPKVLNDEEKKLLRKLATKDGFKSKFKTDLDKSIPPPF